MNLVYLDGKKEPYTTNEIIAEYAEIDRISVRKLIENHKEDLEAFGILSFEMTKINDGRGRPRKIYHLNEQQASLTVKIIETLFNGFGEEGGRNNACAIFVGMLFNRYVNFDIATAYQLTVMANNNTPEPLPEEELDRTFKSIAKKEYSTRL